MSDRERANILWVRPASDGVLAAMEAVERTVAEGGLGATHLDPVIEALHREWQIDLARRTRSDRPIMGGAINAWRRFVTKLLWWLHLPQWGQVSSFHRSALEVIEALLAHQRRLERRVRRLEQALERRAAAEPPEKAR